MANRKSVDVPTHRKQCPENAEREKDRATEIWGEDVRGETRARRLAKMMAVGCEEEFGRSGNPMDAIEALLCAGECGLAPPPGVVRWLFDAFAEYEVGEASMDQLLGLQAKRGTQSPRARRNFEKEIRPLLTEMWDLVNVAEIDVAHAAYMVAARFDAEVSARPDDPKAYGKYTAETLRQYWYRLEIGKQIRTTELIGCTDDAVEEVLSSYPRHLRTM